MIYTINCNQECQILKKLFRKKPKSAIDELDKNELEKQFKQFIYHDEKLSIPVYVGDRVKMRSDIGPLEKDLPLLYVWHDHERACNLVISANGYRLSELLEPFCPRRNVNFSSIRDKMLIDLVAVAYEILKSMCDDTGLSPDEIFGYTVEEY